jgi:chloramphenicol 3-O phosphotransferase
MAAIVFINGTSSSGKTTLAEAYQRLLPDPVLYASVDHFIFMLSDEVLQDDAARMRFLPRVMAAFHRSLPLLASCGMPMVIDHVLEKRRWLDECVLSLREHTVYFIGLHCPVELLDEREQKREDHKLGLARWQASIVHKHAPYDLEIDSSQTSPEDGAGQILGLVRSSTPPAVFPRLRRQILEKRQRRGTLGRVISS